MLDSGSTRQYRDPLLAELEQYRSDRQKETVQTESSSAPRTGGHPALYVLGAVVLIGLGVLGYFLFRAQQRIENLSSALSTSRQQLSTVSSTLEKSEERIENLNKGLDDSRHQLTSQGQELRQYQGLYQGIRSDQEQQTRELQVLHEQKADQTAVVQLKSETTQLQGQLADTNSSVQEARGDIAKLNTRTESNKGAIDQTRADLATVGDRSQKNASDIDGVRRSLEREYYNFELAKNGGYMKIFSVSLALRHTDVGKREYDLYVLADDKVIQKKHQAINEPIVFYTKASKKPYEVVVTRVDKKMVVGYLSVPKS